MDNLNGSPILWQSGIPIALNSVKGDEITPLEVPCIIKVNPSSDMELDIRVIWGDKKNTEVIIKAWETLTSNILVKKVFSTDTDVEDTNIRFYK